VALDAGSRADDEAAQNAMQTIQPNARVVLQYTLHDDAGELLDSSDAEGGGPIEYVHGYGMLVPGLEAALDGLSVGASKQIRITAEEGFGERDEELVMEVDMSDFPDPSSVAVDDEFVAEAPDGEQTPMRVVEVRADSVIVDANHPLAGKILVYAVKVAEICEATEAQIEAAAAGFDDAGYDACCDDPSHDHGAGSASQTPSDGASELVQIASKKPR